MNADIFAEWLRRQGVSVIRTSSSYWHRAAPLVYQAFPYHWTIDPTADELRDLFNSRPLVAARYSLPAGAASGVAGYHVAYDRGPYTMEDLPKGARYDVRRGLSAFEIGPVSMERLASHGWSAREQTLARQGRADAESREWWQRLCTAAVGLEGIEAWAAVGQGGIAASLIAITCDDCCSILYQQSCTDSLRSGVNNALTFAFSSSVLQRPATRWIFYGLQSLDAPASVDEYKYRMNFHRRPVRYRAAIRKWAAPLFSSWSLRGLELAERHVSLNALRKAVGMARLVVRERAEQGSQRVTG